MVKMHKKLSTRSRTDDDNILPPERRKILKKIQCDRKNEWNSPIIPHPPPVFACVAAGLGTGVPQQSGAWAEYGSLCVPHIWTSLSVVVDKDHNQAEKGTCLLPTPFECACGGLSHVHTSHACWWNLVYSNVSKPSTTIFWQARWQMPSCDVWHFWL